MVTLDQRRESLDPETTLADTLTGGGSDYVEVARRAQARRRLYARLPLRARAGAHAGLGPVRRRARPPAPGPRARPALEPPGARRADQRPRPRDPRPLAGDDWRLRGHGDRDQPRPRLSRSCRHLHADVGGRAGAGSTMQVAIRTWSPSAAPAWARGAAEKARAATRHSGRRHGRSQPQAQAHLQGEARRSTPCPKRIDALVGGGCRRSGDDPRRSRPVRPRSRPLRQDHRRRLAAIESEKAVLEDEWLALEMLREDIEAGV